MQGIASLPYQVVEEDMVPRTGIGALPKQAEMLAQFGRKGDTYLVHATKGETVLPMEVFDSNPRLKAMVWKQLREMDLNPEQYVVGNQFNSINPVTGQPEFGLDRLFKGIGKLVRMAIPVIGAVVGGIAGGPWGAAAGAAIGTKVTGGDTQDVIKSAVFAGVGHWGAGKIGGAGGAGTTAASTPTATTANLAGGAGRSLAGLPATTAATTASAIPEIVSYGTSTLGQSALGSGIGSLAAGGAGVTTPDPNYLARAREQMDLQSYTASTEPPGYDYEEAEDFGLPEGEIADVPADTGERVISQEEFDALDPKRFRLDTRTGKKVDMAEMEALLAKGYSPSQAESYSSYSVAAEPGFLARTFPKIAGSGIGQTIADIPTGMKVGLGLGALSYLGAKEQEGAGQVPSAQQIDQQGRTGATLLRQYPERYGFNVANFVPAAATSALGKLVRPQPFSLSPAGAAPNYAPYTHQALTGAPYRPVMQPSSTFVPPPLYQPVTPYRGPNLVTQRLVNAAGGGEIVGPGTGTSDSIPAMLSDGEFVYTERAVKGAGGGDRRQGAARLYKMMKDFENTRYA